VQDFGGISKQLGSVFTLMLQARYPWKMVLLQSVQKTEEASESVRETETPYEIEVWLSDH
jgi:hypothetical protein